MNHLRKLFQFYKVRLKHADYSYNCYPLKFQFYKVRLKHSYEAEPLEVTLISILQSSIKTCTAPTARTAKANFNSTKFD